MNIQPLPGYKKPANIDSIRRPKKQTIADMKKPTEPEPHSAELDAALDAVSQLNADLDNNDHKDTSETQLVTKPKRIDDVTPASHLVEKSAESSVKPKLDDVDMTGNVKLTNSTRPAIPSVPSAEEASLAEIEKNITKAVEDDLGIKRPSVQAEKTDDKDVQSPSVKDGTNKSEDLTATPTNPSTPTATPRPPKPRKMQSLFNVSDFAKPESNIDSDNFSMSSNTMSDNDILTASLSSSPTGNYASSMVDSGTSIDGIRRTTADTEKLDGRQNQSPSDIGYDDESNGLAAQHESLVNRQMADSQSTPAIAVKAPAPAPSTNVAQAIKSIDSGNAVGQAGFIVKKPKQRADFLAIIGIPFGLLAVLMALLPASLILAMKIVGVALLISLPVMALIGLVFGMAALIKDIKQTESINKIIASISIVLAIASVGILYIRSNDIVKDFGTEITKMMVKNMQTDATSRSSSDSSSNYLDETN